MSDQADLAKHYSTVNNINDESENFRNGLDAMKFILNPRSKEFLVTSDIDQDQNLSYLKDTDITQIGMWDEMIYLCNVLGIPLATNSYLRDKKSLLVTARSRGGFQQKQNNTFTKESNMKITEDKKPIVQFGMGGGNKKW